MAKYIIRHSSPLSGEVTISGAKNAVLPLMAATLLSTEECKIYDVPELADVAVMRKIMESIGSVIDEPVTSVLNIQTEKIHTVEPDNELVGMMRASFVMMGPLLGREGKSSLRVPGDRVLALLAAMRTACHPQHHAEAFAVQHIVLGNVVIIHALLFFRFF